MAKSTETKITDLERQIYGCGYAIKQYIDAGQLDDAYKESGELKELYQKYLKLTSNIN